MSPIRHHHHHITNSCNMNQMSIEDMERLRQQLAPKRKKTATSSSSSPTTTKSSSSDEVQSVQPSQQQKKSKTEKASTATSTTKMQQLKKVNKKRRQIKLVHDEAEEVEEAEAEEEERRNNRGEAEVRGDDSVSVGTDDDNAAQDDSDDADNSKQDDQYNVDKHGVCIDSCDDEASSSSSSSDDSSSSSSSSDDDDEAENKRKKREEKKKKKKKKEKKEKEKERKKRNDKQRKKNDKKSPAEIARENNAVDQKLARYQDARHDDVISFTGKPAHLPAIAAIIKDEKNRQRPAKVKQHEQEEEEEEEHDNRRAAMCEGDGDGMDFDGYDSEGVDADAAAAKAEAAAERKQQKATRVDDDSDDLENMLATAGSAAASVQKPAKASSSSSITTPKRVVVGDEIRMYGNDWVCTYLGTTVEYNAQGKPDRDKLAESCGPECFSTFFCKSQPKILNKHGKTIANYQLFLVSNNPKHKPFKMSVETLKLLQYNGSTEQFNAFVQTMHKNENIIEDKQKGTYRLMTTWDEYENILLKAKLNKPAEAQTKTKVSSNSATRAAKTSANIPSTSMPVDPQTEFLFTATNQWIRHVFGPLLADVLEQMSPDELLAKLRQVHEVMQSCVQKGDNPATASEDKLPHQHAMELIGDINISTLLYFTPFMDAQIRSQVVAHINSVRPSITTTAATTSTKEKAKERVESAMTQSASTKSKAPPSTKTTKTTTVTTPLQTKDVNSKAAPAAPAQGPRSYKSIVSLAAATRTAVPAPPPPPKAELFPWSMNAFDDDDDKENAVPAPPLPAGPMKEKTEPQSEVNEVPAVSQEVAAAANREAIATAQPKEVLGIKDF